MKTEAASDYETTQTAFLALAQSLNHPENYSDNALRNTFQQINNDVLSNRVREKHISELCSEKRERTKKAKKAKELELLLTPSPPVKLKSDFQSDFLPPPSPFAKSPTKDPNGQESDFLPPPSPFAKSPTKDPNGRFYRNSLDEGGVNALLGRLENPFPSSPCPPKARSSSLKERIVDYLLGNVDKFESKEVGTLIRILSDKDNMAVKYSLEGYERMKEDCPEIAVVTDTMIAMFCSDQAIIDML